MQYNNRNYPHPVLGISNDYPNANFSIELNVMANRDVISVSPIFVLHRAEAIETLIESNDASYIAHVYCRGTMYREIYRSKKNLLSAIEIPASKLHGEVEVDFFICSEKAISNFTSNSFNEEYGDTKFNFEKTDILAYAGKGKFFANKSALELRSISALMVVDCYKTAKGPMRLDYEGEKITILLCKEDYFNYKLLKERKEYFGVILSSLVLPALMEVIHSMKDDAGDYNDKAWHVALSKIIQDSKVSGPLAIAQNILENPVYKCFTLLTADEHAD